jgi:hypothetical protein
MKSLSCEVRGSPIDDSLRKRLAKAVSTHGERRVIAVLGCSAYAIARALAGLNVSAGTTALVEAGLARMAGEEAHTASRLADAKQIAGGRP